MSDEYRIQRAGNHYEVYINGFFYCTADTVAEAANDIEEFRKEESLNEERNHQYA